MTAYQWKDKFFGLLLLLIGLFLVMPVLCGVAISLLGSFGYIRGVHFADHLSWEHWIKWCTQAITWKSSYISLFIALSSTLISVFLASRYWALRSLKTTKIWFWLIFLMLSAPHLALATGVESLFSDSGLVNRLICFALSCTHTSGGLASLSPLFMIIYTLVLKETIFLIFVYQGALSQLDANRMLRVGQSLGYSRYRSYCLLVLPQVYRSTRLALFMVFSYSISVVEIPLIFSGTQNKSLSLLIWQNFRNPYSLDSYLTGFVGSMFLIGLFIIGCLMFMLLDFARGKFLNAQIINGQRQETWGVLFGSWFFKGLFIIGWVGPMLVHGLWTMAKNWRFPDLLPDGYSFKNYVKAWQDLHISATNTIILAVSVVLISVTLTLLIVEYAKHKRYLLMFFNNIAVLPLVIPQISFLFGFQTILEAHRLSGTWLSLIWIHTIFCFGYSYLLLKDQVLLFDRRFNYVAYSLGLSRLKTWLKIKFLMILPFIINTLGVVFSVSIALYLPTIFVSGGHQKILVVETMALLSSYNPKIIAVYSIVLMFLPLSFFLIINLYKKNYRG